MAGGKVIRRSTRSTAGSAGGGRVSVGGGGRVAKRNARASQKRVSFSPNLAEDSDDSDDSDFTPVSVTSTRRGARTPSSSSASNFRQNARVTPYPYRSSSQPEEETETTTPIRQRRRRSRASRALFPTPPSKQGKDNKRPQTTITAQLKYVIEVLPGKVAELKTNKNNMCHAARNRELAALEDNLLERIAVVSKLDTRDGKELTQDRQQEVLDHMTNSLVSLQDLLEGKKAKLDDVRPGLRASFNMRYVCCPICAEKEKRRKSNK